MKRIIYHVIIPTFMVAGFFVVALMPVEVLGCFMRGLIALLIAFVSGLAALGAAIIGAKGRVRGRGLGVKAKLYTLQAINKVAGRRLDY